MSEPEASKSLTVDEALELGVRLHQQGHVAGAEAVYRQVLKAVPDHPDALHFLGMALEQQNRSEEALASIGRSIEIAPEHPDSHNSLGNVFRGAGRLEEASAAYRKAIELRPDFFAAWLNLGVVLRADGRFAEALAASRRAVELGARVPDAYYALARVLSAVRDFQGAIGSFQKAIELSPRSARFYDGLARLYYHLGKTEDARSLFRKWLDHDPENPVALHMFAAVSRGEPPRRASDEFVRELFGAFADTFDENLRNLEYRAPDLIAAAVAAEVGPPEGTLDVLDAGCGTGLSGIQLRPFARRLVGVDLAPQMLQRARGRGIYDEVAEGEMTAFLESRAGEFDVIVFCDTLVYFGAIREVLAGARRALRPGGCVAFTLEAAAEEPPEGYRLEPHGRYCHGIAYVERTLAETGFVPRSTRRETLRKELGEPVSGFAVVGVRPGSGPLVK